MGGLPVQEDIAKFRNKQVHIVVGSPGRLRNLVQEKHIDVDAVRLLVLDEADKLMEKSFLPDINYIFSVLPKQKQVIMSSATYPSSTKTFINRYVQCAQHICPDTSSILLGIEQKITAVKYNVNVVKQTKYRFEELLKILAQKQFKQCLIFCNYQVRVAELHKMLSRKKWPAEQLYGQQDQTDRLDALKTLQEYKCRILVSTDLAARGIDASNVDLVINFEPPLEWQTYLHRIGRAGRYGSYGMAITILSDGREYKKFTEMIGILGPSVNISNFWNKSNVEESNITPPAENTEIPTVNSAVEPVILDDKYDKLWKIYTSDSFNSTKEIESFENLCSSFDTADGIIETFSDLINSFESHENVDIENSNLKYRHLQMPTIPTKDYFNWIQHLCGDEKNECNTSTVHDENGKATDTEGINVKTFGDVKCTANKSDMNNVTANKLFNKNGLHNQKDNKDENISEIEFTSISEAALRHAGLPISFGSSKMKHDKSKSYTKCSNSKNTARISNVSKHAKMHKQPQYKEIITDTAQYKLDTDESERTSMSDDSEKNGSVKLEKKNIFRNRLQYELETNESERTMTSDDDDDSELSNSVKKKLIKSNKYKPAYHKSGLKYFTDGGENEDNGYNTMSHSQSKAPTFNKSHHKNGYDCNNSNYSNQGYRSDSTSNQNRKYMEWYNQLKCRMRQIELAVYIEEMSRI